MGVYRGIREQLASIDLAFACFGLSALWAQASRASPDESSVSSGQYAAAFWGAAPNDGSNVVERICGGAFCVRSGSRGIGGLGLRTQGCTQCIFLAADLVRIFEICK